MLIFTSFSLLYRVLTNKSIDLVVYQNRILRTISLFKCVLTRSPDKSFKRLVDEGKVDEHSS